MNSTQPITTTAATILVVEDSPPQAFVLRKLLQHHGYKATVAGDGAEALELVRKQPPDLILSDVNMPVMNGYEMCLVLKSDPATASIPVILLTTLSDSTSILEGLKCKADYYLTKPYESKYLLDRVQSLLVEDSMAHCVETPAGLEITFEGKLHLVTATRQQMLNLLLSTYENAVQQNLELIKTQQKLNNLNQELQDQSRKLKISEKSFRALLENSVDAMLVTDAAGIIRFVNPAAERLFNRPSTELLGTYLPFTTSPGEAKEMSFPTQDPGLVHLDLRTVSTDWEGQIAMLVSLRDITQRIVDEQKIKDQQSRLQEANSMLEALATLDGLTGIINHRVLKERLEDEYHRSSRYTLPISLIILDVDHFKQFNDSFGHPAGDEVLKAVARLLEENSRDTDLVARYGGEEFVVLLPLTQKADALHLAERLRSQIQSFPWDKRAVTVSLGVATETLHFTKAEDLISKADTALYISKNRGRNQVTHHDELPRP